MVLKVSTDGTVEKLQNRQPSSTANLGVDYPLDKTGIATPANSKTQTSGSTAMLETQPT